MSDLLAGVEPGSRTRTVPETAANTDGHTLDVLVVGLGSPDPASGVPAFYAGG